MYLIICKWGGGSYFLMWDQAASFHLNPSCRTCSVYWLGLEGHEWKQVARRWRHFQSPQDKSWKIVDSLAINDFSKSKMDATAAELMEERDTAVAFLAAWQNPAGPEPRTPDARLWRPRADGSVFVFDQRRVGRKPKDVFTGDDPCTSSRTSSLTSTCYGSSCWGVNG